METGSMETGPMETGPSNHADRWEPPPKPPMPPKGGDYVHDTSSFYARVYYALQRWWDAPISRAIPSEFLDTTPFSMGLLLELKKLAEFTPKNRVVALNLLELCCRRRQESQKPGQYVPAHVTTSTEGVVKGPTSRFLEDEIKENPKAIMICDVRQAILHVKNSDEKAEMPAGSATTTKSGKVKIPKALKRSVLNNALKSSVERELAIGPSAHAGPLREPLDSRDAGELRMSLRQLNFSEAKKGSDRLRRQRKLQQRMASKPKEALPSERSQPGSLYIRSTAQVDSDRLVSSMASLTPAGLSAKVYEMRADVVDDMDEDEDEDEDEEMEEDEDEDNGGVKLPRDVFG